MKSINLFPDYPTHAEQGVPLFEARSPHIPEGFWNTLLEQIKTTTGYRDEPGLFVAEKATLPDGSTPAKQYCICQQIEHADNYIFFIDILTLQTTRFKLAGYWVQRDSQILVLSFPKDFSCVETVNLWKGAWWLQYATPPLKTENALENIQIAGLDNFKAMDESKLTFRWAPRGLMKLRILPKAQFGFKYGFDSSGLYRTFLHLGTSRLRIRRKFEWGWPTSRTFWSLWRAFFDLFIRDFT